jgi:hypothetical protein
MGPAAPILISLAAFGVQDAASSPNSKAMMVNGRGVVTGSVRRLSRDQGDGLKSA